MTVGTGLKSTPASLLSAAGPVALPVLTSLCSGQGVRAASLAPNHTQTAGIYATTHILSLVDMDSGNVVCKLNFLLHTILSVPLTYVPPALRNFRAFFSLSLNGSDYLSGCPELAGSRAKNPLLDIPLSAHTLPKSSQKH